MIAGTIENILTIVLKGCKLTMHGQKDDNKSV